MVRYVLQTPCHTCMIPLDHFIQDTLKKTKVQNGIMVVFVPHTTAAVTISENADPDVEKDVLCHLAHLIPKKANFSHSEGNSDAHIKSVLTGSSVIIIIDNGKSRLGTWQSVFFCEFDGPRQREVWIQVIQTAMSSADEIAIEKPR